MVLGSALRRIVKIRQAKPVRIPVDNNAFETRNCYLPNKNPMYHAV